MKTAKEQVKQLVDALPDNVTLYDIRYQLNDSIHALYMRQQFEQGMQDSLASRVVSHTYMKKRYQNEKR